MTEKPHKEKKKRPLWRIALKILMIIIGLILILSLSLRLPFVQKYLTNSVANSIASDLGYEVSVGYVNFNFINKLTIKDILILYETGDTLLYAERLHATTHKPLTSLLSQNLEINKIELDGSFLQILEKPGIRPFQWDREVSRGAFPFRYSLSLDAVVAGNSKFVIENQYEGSRESVTVKALYLTPDHFDFEHSHFVFQTLVVDSAHVEVERFTPLAGEKFDLPGIEDEEPSIPMPILFRPGFTAQMDFFELRNSAFSSVDHIQSERSEGYKPFFLDSINIELGDLKLDTTSIVGQPKHISFNHPTGLKLLDLRAKDFFFSDKQLKLTDLELITEESYINETLVLDYNDLSDFDDFINKVALDAHFINAEVMLKELMYLIPDLRDNPFFNKNRDRKFIMSGQFKGPVNQLRGEGISIDIPDDFHLTGSFRSSNLTVPGEEHLNVEVESLRTGMGRLKNIIPDFTVPEGLAKFEELDFSGRFDGKFNNFEAGGHLFTNLGNFITDFELNIEEGIELARYSGTLGVENFNLREWTGNDDFDQVNFYAEIEDGMGLTKESVNAQLMAEVNSFSFRGYEYDALQMDGFVSSRLFDGFFSIQDENLDFQLIGTVFYGSDDPYVNAEIRVNEFNTLALQLTDKHYGMSGYARVNATGLDIDFPEGNLKLEDWQINYSDSIYTHLDSLTLIAEVGDNLKKRLQIDSEIFSAEISGSYYLNQLGDVFKDFVLRNYGYAHLLFEDTIVTPYSETEFEFDLAIKNTKSFTSFLIPGLDTIKEARIHGEINTIDEEHRIEFSFPTVHYGNNSLEDLYIYTQFDDQWGNTLINAGKIQAGALAVTNPSSFFIDFSYDTINFSISTTDYSDLVDQVYIEGKTYPYDNHWGINFARSRLTVFGEDWEVMENNEVQIGKQFFRTNNLKLESDEKSISIQSINDRGISLNLVGLDIEFLNEFINDHRYELSGDLNLDLWVANLFEFDALHGELLVDNFFFQDIDYGLFFAESSLKTGSGILEFNLKTDHPDRHLAGDGLIYVDAGKIPHGGNVLDSRLEIRDFPMMMYQKIIETGITNTVGTFNGDLRVFAEDWSDVKMDGQASIYNTATTVDLLGTRYFIDEQDVKITERKIDFTGVVFQDELGNAATITNGFNHHLFGDMSMNLSITSNRILAMNTDREDSNLYYGRIVGQLEAFFVGSFQRPDIRVNAVNGPGTRLYVLVNEFVETGDIDFVSFEEDQTTQTRDFFSEVTGVNFLLDITANEDAEVHIIFNEQTGDILRGRGNGALQVSLTRNGEFNIFGDYEISQGKYLFANTLGLLPINKPFDVLRGGSIQWTGDPLNAIIDIQATYSGLSAAPYNFVEDYIQSSAEGQDENIIAEANQATPVDLTLLLTGFLINPEINFSIDFPNLTGQLKNLADRKILDLEENPDEMNRQVFALIVIGGFLPSTLDYSTSVATIANTFNEWISNQLSVYLTDLLSEAFDEVGFITGIEMDVGYVLPTGDILNVGTATTSRQGEIRIGLRPSLFDDRVQLNVGGNYVRESFVTTDPYLAPYGILEYFITPDRRWRLRLSSNLDYVPEGRRNRHSVGLLFRREFDSMEEFMQSIRLFDRKEKEQQEEESIFN